MLKSRENHRNLSLILMVTLEKQVASWDLFCSFEGHFKGLFAADFESYFSEFRMFHDLMISGSVAVFGGGNRQ